MILRNNPPKKLQGEKQEISILSMKYLHQPFNQNSQLLHIFLLLSN